MITPMIAAKAYAAAQSQAPSIASAADADASTSAAPNFAQMVKGVIDGAVQASRNAENQMTAQVQGKAQLVDVVTAISSAEASLQTVMAVRDEVISAYQEIMHMTI